MEEKSMEIDLTTKATELAEATDRPAADVLLELNTLVNEGFSYVGAVARWKSNNKIQLGAGRMEWVARLIGTEPPRTVSFDDRETMVMNYHWIVPDQETGEMTFKSSSIWGEQRIEDLADSVNVGGVYRFKAAIRQDGSLTRVSPPEQVDDSLIPEIDEVEPLPIEKLPDALGTNELIRGVIGRIINIGSEPVAFEISDMSVAPPVTVWYGGQYSKIPYDRVLEISTNHEGDEVCAYGYISQSSSDIRMNAVNIVKVR